ncbi:hypothetical protein FACS1894208_00660 [Clostridia bacterium]|nr:hypothetical protein FACS1894208_00660 [Clostridia bacterium]
MNYCDLPEYDEFLTRANMFFVRSSKTGSSLTVQGDRKGLTFGEAIGEFTVQGAYPKGLFREKDGIYMYKTGEMHTGAAEVLCSQLLDCTNVFGHVQYNQIRKYGVVASRCKLITDHNTDIIHAIDVTDCMEYAMNKFMVEVAQMCVFDYLVGNRNRHGKNWGFIRRAENNWAISGLHPLYDHNNAFDKDELLNGTNKTSCLGMSRGGNCTLADAAKRMYKHSNFKFVAPVSKKWFSIFGDESRFVLEHFTRRCECLGIPVTLA